MRKGGQRRVFRAVPTTINGRYVSAWGAPYALPTPHAKLPPLGWTDEGIVLGVRRHGESSAIAELLTRDHGRHLGLVRGGSGSRMRPWLQPGNGVRAGWRGRLDGQLRAYEIARTQLTGAPVPAARSAPGYLRDARPHAR